jgi:hypothetical protein
MRNIIPIIFVTAILLVGCQSSRQAAKTTPVAATTAGTKTTANANTIAGTNVVVATPAPAPAPVGPNTPDQTLAENNKLGNLAGAFLVVLSVAAVRRP